MMRGRGLVFTLDMIASLILFLVIIVSVLWLWGQAHRHMDELRQTDARNAKLLHISSALVKTGGNPTNWHTLGTLDKDTVKSIGLASEENELDPRKLDAMAGADYERLRVIMGLGKEDFRLTVTENWSGDNRTVYEIGVERNTSEQRVIRRYAILNGTVCEVRLDAYYEGR